MIENGALHPARSLNMDQVWAAYEKLVDTYYRLKAGAQLTLQGEHFVLPERVTD